MSVRPEECCRPAELLTRTTPLNDTALAEGALLEEALQSAPGTMVAALPRIQATHLGRGAKSLR